VLGCALASTAWSVRKLLVTLGRPPVYAALFVPMLFAFSASWGFLNYVVALALAFAALTGVAAHLRGPAHAGWTAARIAILSLLSAMTHPLAMLVLWVFSAALVLEVSGRDMTTRISAARRAATAFAPTLAGGLWYAAVYVGHYASAPHLTDTRDPVLWPKLARFPFYATDLHADRSDGPIVYGAVAIMVAIVACRFVLDRVRTRRGAPAASEPLVVAPTHAVILPFATMLACYLAMPMIFMGSQLMFPRLVPALVVGALIALPRIDGSDGGVARALAAVSCLAVAWWSALNLNAHFREYRDETDDASRLLDALPTGRRASAVVYSDFTDAFCRGGVLHLAAWYAARKHGDWAFAFARYPYMPVRYIEGRAPDWPEHGWEFAPSQYDARSTYARTYDLLLVKTLEYLDPIQNEATVRANVFGADAATPRLLAHYGLYWAFDTAGIPGREREAPPVAAAKLPHF
jgi:hypothetical protein